MTEEAHASEELVCHYLESKHGFGFHLVSHELQKVGKDNGWHVPDIHSKKNPKTTIEVISAELRIAKKSKVGTKV